jgi:hypothetical protein
MEINNQNSRRIVGKSIKCNSIQLNIAHKTKRNQAIEFLSKPGFGFSDLEGMMSSRPNNSKAVTNVPLSGI